MSNIYFLVFRRMRQPLLTLILTYAIAVLGLVLIPGQDDAGNAWHMDFFHAFYFVSYTATTIGFGEIPYAFTEAQRMWVTFSLYATVVGWIYAIGTLLSLVQDKAFQQAMTENRYMRRIRQMREPFYIVCGYGETGSALVYALTRHDQAVTVIDIDDNRVNLVQLHNLQRYVPALHGDAAETRTLLLAGLEHESCQGVVAITDVNEVNLKVAITSKLLHPDIKVICRSDRHDVSANMASFGTDHIIDPFDTFAGHMATALAAPGLFLMHEWLSGERSQSLQAPIRPPVEGRWIVCGFGRFGKAVYRRLKEAGIDPVVIEAQPELTGCPTEGVVRGPGTEAVTLEEAGIRDAVGLVAGTNDDANNLSIVMTARELRSDLFVVIRQNQKDNRRIIEAVDANMVMHPSAIIANRIRVLLATPLLYEFMNMAMAGRNNDWARDLLSRISLLVAEEKPHVWEVRLNHEDALALSRTLEQGQAVELGQIMNYPTDRTRRLKCLPLLHKRGMQMTVLPGNELSLQVGDQLLFCGRNSARSQLEWGLQNELTLSYLLTGEIKGRSWLWQLFEKHSKSDQQAES